MIQEIATEFKMLQSISAEVVADTAEEMYEQAQAFKDYRTVTIKVPCTVEGLKACRMIREEQKSVNVTLVFSVAQAILAEKAGATYVSPFVGRWVDNSVDGIGLIKDIKRVYNNHGRFQTTNVLSASLRDVRQVEQSFLMGADVCTIPPLVFWKMYKNILTDKGLELFQADWDDVNK